MYEITYVDTDLNNTTGANFAQGRHALEQMFSNVLGIPKLFSASRTACHIP